jgi:hypothetical protein
MTRPEFDLTGPIPTPPPPPQPALLRADCEHPRHTCAAAHQRALRECVPILVVHRHATIAKLKLYVSKPWRLTPAAQRAVLGIFEAHGASGALEPGARCLVDGTGAEFRVPTPIAEPFTADVVQALEFAKVLP